MSKTSLDSSGCITSACCKPNSELCPVDATERQSKGCHDLRSDALADEVIKSDTHGDEGLRAAAQLPELCQVYTKVCQRIYRKDNHVYQVYLNALPFLSDVTPET